MASVLVADRDAPARTFVTELLTDIGHHVRQASGFDEASRIARRAWLDIVVLDGGICDESTGQALVRSATSRNPALRLIALLGSDAYRSAPEFALSANAAVIAKPIELRELFRALYRPVIAQRGRSSFDSNDEAVAAPREITIAPLVKSPLREARAEFERAYLRYHYRAAKGDWSLLLRRVGLDRSTLYRKLEQLGIAL
jgi:DNA-binding NtrC family response regulator